MFQLRHDQMAALGEDWVRRNLGRFRGILERSGALEAGGDRDAELEAYLLAGWRLGLRREGDLAIYASVCCRSGGDIGRVGSMHELITANLDAEEGPMLRLLRTLPLPWWHGLKAKLRAKPGGLASGAQ